MDLKVVFLVVSLVTLSIISTDALIPKCCIKTRNIPYSRLLKVYRWEVQSSSGPCDIDALVLYIKDQRKPSCVHPIYEKRLQKVMIWREERKHRKY
ncbi:C-C motif chemokine 27b [Poeciliopsis prolifica]|uniref:C-C motif chemokine 27b n=1 Tax=Poeciliopsis prolifica TaxID=188132 RepID=UPI002413549E|nr:C-C motif chemokine 27b [Poeciliopsis prolifica]